MGLEYDESENSEDDGAAGLENHDSDEDDPANSPTRHASRKGKSAGVKASVLCSDFGLNSTVVISLPVHGGDHNNYYQQASGQEDPSNAEEG